MIHRTLVTGLVLAALSSTLLASNGRNPGSLLMFPEFDNTVGTRTVVTVTNLDTVMTNDPIEVEFMYIGKYDTNGDSIGCLEFNRTETLTPADTITLLTDAHNPEHEQGYLYVFTKNASTHLAQTHNFLIGNVMSVNGILAFEYAINPVSYLGIGSDDGDGILALDNVEYSGTPGEIVIPRFFGQNGVRQSELIMIGLSGGTAFSTTIDFLIFNDNEEIFSSEHTFQCWERTHLIDISGVFANGFLANWTNDDPLELVGLPNIETGWIHIEGAQYSSNTVTYPDPSVYAVLVERIGNLGIADLPFEMGATRLNGELLPHNIGS